MMEQKNPLISCLCVTKGSFSMVKQSIMLFESQTYPNKEMLIVHEGDQALSCQLKSYVCNAPNIYIYEIPLHPKTSLGSLRNIGISKAHGDFICQWDDDDWYHIKRLELQYQAIAESDFSGSILSQWLVYDSSTKKCFLSNVRLWEGSILCKKEVLTLKKYDDFSQGEDTSVVQFLHQKRLLDHISDLPHLYVYIFHGNNTWNYAHWREIFMNSRELPSKYSRYVTDIVNGEYSPLTGSELLDELFT